jgi:4-carboxymuconolactone decarboxylase
MAQLNLSLDQMPEKAQALYDEIKAKRGSVGTMYRTLLNHPDLAEHISELGAYLRFGATLPGDVREVMILLASHAMGADYEWIKHMAPARAAGVPEDVIAAIRVGEPLSSLNSDFGLLEQLRACVAEHESIPQRLQDAIVAKWGATGILELVILVGFYSMIGDILTSFDVPLPTTEMGA